MRFVTRIRKANRRRGKEQRKLFGLRGSGVNWLWSTANFPDRSIEYFALISIVATVAEDS